MGNTTALDEYLKEKIRQIKATESEGVSISNPVTFEFHTVSTKEAGGKLKFLVINVGAKVADKEVHKTTIPYDFKSETDIAKERAEKAMAEKIEKELGT
jgi:hypothetical protein